MSLIASKTGIVHTIGYEGITLERFLRKLHDEEIDLVIDIRANPISRKPGFSKKALSAAVAVEGISYQHFPELGIPSKIRKQYDNYRDLFKYYESDILPTVTDSIKNVADLCKENNAVLLCFEEKASDCHRSHLSAYIKNHFGLVQHHIFF